MYSPPSSTQRLHPSRSNLLRQSSTKNKRILNTQTLILKRWKTATPVLVKQAKSTPSSSKCQKTSHENRAQFHRTNHLQLLRFLTSPLMPKDHASSILTSMSPNLPSPRAFSSSLQPWKSNLPKSPSRSISRLMSRRRSILVSSIQWRKRMRIPNRRSLRLDP